MLNLITNDVADQQLLSASFDAIRLKEKLSFVLDEKERSAVMRQTIDALRMPNGGEFSFQNLFRMDADNGTFYIAQVLIGYPSPLGNKGSQTFYAKYDGILLSTKNDELYISFAEELIPNQSRAIEDIFRAADFLSR